MLDSVGKIQPEEDVYKRQVEAFGDGGRFVMTNQVFPSEPYNHIDF